MKKFILVLLAAIAPVVAQNDFEMGIKITNSNGDTVNRAMFGIKQNATKYIDEDLGEFAFPSLMPSILSSAFRFYEPSYEENILSYKDFRPDFSNDMDSIVYNFEITGIFNGFKLEWGEFPEGVKSAIIRSKFISDKYNSFDMKAIKSIEVENDAVTDFTIVLRNHIPTNNVEFNNFDLVQLFPNPANNIVNLESDLEIIKIQVSDLFGKIFDTKLEKNYVNIENLPIGIYYISIFTSDSQVIRKKIIKI